MVNSGIPDGGNQCNKTPDFEEFSNEDGIAFADNVAAYASTEPADDYSVIGLYIFARSI